LRTMKKSIIAVMILLLMSNFAYAGTSDLSKYSNKELVDLFGKCLNDTKDMDQAGAIKEEIIKRKAIKETFELFKNKDNAFWTLGWCYQVFINLRSPETNKLLKPSANQELNERSYFANKYFAEAGETFALKNLNANYFKYPVSSAEWGETALLFGKYKYYPAKKNLVSSINAASLNLVEDSEESLKLLYPETRKKVENLDIQETIKFYSKYIKNH
jgi:hypothetical protein